jgi:hypothetical protein
VRAPRPCSRALTCHAPRPLLRPRCEAATTPSCAHATRAAAPCSVAPMADATRATASAASQARTTIFAHRAAPLGPAGLLARPSRGAREHATLDVGPGARPRPSSRHATLDAMHGGGRHAAEHGRRAPRGRDSRSRSRECSRQDRGEVRAPRPCSRALTCHAPRPLLRPRCEAATTPSCAKATRAAAPCSVAPMADATRATASAASQARTTIFAHRAAPLGPAGLFARPSRQAREHATLDSRCRARARPRPSCVSIHLAESSALAPPIRRGPACGRAPRVAPPRRRGTKATRAQPRKRAISGRSTSRSSSST